MKPNLFSALMICALLLFPSLQGQEEDNLFYLPDMEAELFDTGELDFGRRGTFDKSGLVAALARIASDFDPEEKNGKVPNLLRSNALGIAGRINPEAKSFKTTYEQLAQDAEAYGSSGTSKDRLVGNIFRGIRTLLKEKSNEDNRICAAYCVDVALRFLPGHKSAGDLEKIQQDLENDGIEIDWDQLQGKAVVKETPWNPFGQGGRMAPRKEKMPGGDAKSLASNQSSVVGLVVVTLGSGKHAGAAAEIIATALREENVKGVEFNIDQKVGDMMGNSLKSIRDYLRVTYEPKGMVPDGYQVSIVFQDRDQRVDGPSAGTAMALMLDSLFSGEKLDEEFACTGGITPNGKVTSIGGVAAKIRGATRRKCKIVGVPEGNAKGVSDILVLDGIQPLLDIQVFTMKDMDEARTLSRAEKEKDVQSTLDDFKSVADVIADQGDTALKNSRVQERLEEVLENMPNHISAQLLLDYIRGKAPEQLSVGGSFHEIDSRSSGVFSRVQRMMFRGKLSEGAETRSAAEDARKELEELDGKVHEKFEEYHRATIGICRTIEEGIEDGEKEFLRELKSKWSKINSIRKKLRDDPEIFEEIRG
ncbi:MAG: hypothetical protein MK194_07415 [Roseibacillus sp.]|nr:hypothetical protein [Roseibacillus sp.]